jgi:hypothetical protein
MMKTGRMVKICQMQDVCLGFEVEVVLLTSRHRRRNIEEGGLNDDDDPLPALCVGSENPLAVLDYLITSSSMP